MLETTPDASADGSPILLPKVGFLDGNSAGRNSAKWSLPDMPGLPCITPPTPATHSPP
ncbi:hypothetical protein MIZ03_1277 [Rhodoferax lithotrophicus]|uniref:Uncharacterized protein n=1 Tax=Rhodoferax lithotrophicus TaxID=2798804 RepID=A0ABM7MJG1_9BURK|nr:hypothetical protein MIZ03_1277 [Rhodoferax sp. MIZ03]